MWPFSQVLEEITCLWLGRPRGLEQPQAHAGLMSLKRFPSGSCREAPGVPGPSDCVSQAGKSSYSKQLLEKA